MNRIRITPLADRTELSIERRDRLEYIDHFADAERGRDLLLRLKVMANLDHSSRVRQTGQINLTVSGQPVTILVEAEYDDCVETVTRHLVHNSDE